MERRWASSVFGPSHVLMVGAGPPMVVLHGSLSSSAHAASELVQLSRHFTLVLPDLPGQSAHGPERVLAYDGTSHADWLASVMDSLRLEHAPVMGISLGGYVALRMAVMKPQRVRGLVLVVSAGLVQAPAWASMRRVGLAFALYKMRASPANLRRLMLPQFTQGVDETWMEYFEAALQCFVLRMKLPPLAKDDELRGLACPVLAFGAADDVHFPGPALLSRLTRTLGEKRAQCELLECRHTPPMTPEFRDWFAQRVGTFVSGLP